eukprot:snap_masked-scaffold_13-processed-gene-3.24-mRNA-1 protein AED:1.00 eAED:1.00 QI:0/0/0/0/1/1/2/0/260
MKVLPLLMYFLWSVQAEIIVTFLNEDNARGPYRTTRFSELIGTFSSDCVISTNATFLGSSEDPCKRSSIITDLTGLVVFAFSLESQSCYPEKAYENLESLGAAAVVNVGRRPAGSNMYASYFGYPIGKGSIPFVDTSYEFFEDVYKEIKDSSENVFVELDGCDDENQIKVCYEVSEVVTQWLFMPITLLNLLTARKYLKKIKNTEGTAPRIFILKFLFYQNYVLITGFTQLRSVFQTETYSIFDVLEYFFISVMRIFSKV